MVHQFNDKTLISLDDLRDVSIKSGMGFCSDFFNKEIKMNVSLKYNDWIPMDENHPPQIGARVLITYKHKHIVEKQISTAL